MKKLGYLIVLLVASANAFACTAVRSPPAVALKSSSAVVIAAPISITYRPGAASNSKFVGTFTQTVTWRVTRSYKGSLAADDTFFTSEIIEKNYIPCGVYKEIFGREKRLLYLLGKSSPYQFLEIELSQATDDFEILESIK